MHGDPAPTLGERAALEHHLPRLVRLRLRGYLGLGLVYIAHTARHSPQEECMWGFCVGF